MNSHEAPALSVVLPIYNEAESLPQVISEITSALASLELSYEIIAVDDGSSDESRFVLERLKASAPQLNVLSHGDNRGQSAAMFTGWRAARGRFVALMDADLQADPRDIAAMLDALAITGADLAAGIRASRHDTLWKRLQSKVANRARNWITGDDVTDTGCPLKVGRRECFDPLPLFNGVHRFLVTLVRAYGFTAVEMAVRHRPRQFGSSKYSAWNRAWRGLIDCFAVRWLVRRAVRVKRDG